MHKKLFSGIAIALLAGGLSLSSTSPASAAPGGGEVWTQTSCNYHNGNVTYTYTSNFGHSAETIASVGGLFHGSEDDLAKAVVRVYTEQAR
ncbi:hypothetical protein [Flexivirga sp. B27]